MVGTSTATQRIPTIEIVVTGALDVWTAPAVAITLEQAGALHPQQLIIDLAECPSIDAAGILLLLDTHRRAIRNGGTVALRSPSPKLQRNIRLAKLDRVLQVLDLRPTQHVDDSRQAT